MGSKLAPYLSNIFMCQLENSLKTKYTKFPRIWHRYVDDVFAVVKKEHIEDIISELNIQYNTIKFTIEKEENGFLPFLDLKIIRKENNKIKFGIYRKPTHTDRFITANSFHNNSHKSAAFHALSHRLFNIPMEEEEFEKERKHIIQTAKINGYNEQFIDKIINRHKRKSFWKNHTTLTTEETTTKRICVPFYPAVTNKLQNILKKHNIQLITKSSTIKNNICNYKDKEELSQKSGVYKISCNNCDNIYIGQTSRPFEKRLREHVTAVDKKEISKSNVARHMIENEHEINLEKSKLFKVVNKKYQLDAYEAMYIQHNKPNLMNAENAPISITSNLFNISSLKLKLSEADRYNR